MAIPLDSKPVNSNNYSSKMKPVNMNANSAQIRRPKVSSYQQQQRVNNNNNATNIITRQPVSINSSSTHFSFVHQLIEELYGLYLQYSSAPPTCSNTMQNYQPRFPDIIPVVPLIQQPPLSILQQNNNNTNRKQNKETATKSPSCSFIQQLSQNTLKSNQNTENIYTPVVSRSNTNTIGLELRRVADSYQKIWTNSPRKSYEEDLINIAVKLGLIGSVIIIIRLRNLC